MNRAWLAAVVVAAVLIAMSGRPAQAVDPTNRTVVEGAETGGTFPDDLLVSDDSYLTETFAWPEGGDGVSDPFVPDGDGYTIGEFFVTGCSVVGPWADCVDEQPPDDASSFLRSISAVTSEFSVTIEPVSFNWTANPISVTVHARVRCATQDQNPDNFIRINGVSYYNASPVCTASTSWVDRTSTYSVNPATFQPWALADLQNAEMGVRDDTAVGSDLRVTAVWLTVNTVYRLIDVYLDWAPSPFPNWTVSMEAHVEDSVAPYTLPTVNVYVWDTLYAGWHFLYAFTEDTDTTKDAALSSRYVDNGVIRLRWLGVPADNLGAKLLVDYLRTHESPSSDDLVDLGFSVFWAVLFLTILAAGLVMAARFGRWGKGGGL